MARSLKASLDGIKKAKDALKRKGCTQEYLAGASSCTRQTIGKFFARKSIDKAIFQNICSELGLVWEAIANFESELEQNISVNYSKSESVCEESQTSTSTVLTTSISQESITREAIFVLTGTIKLADKAKLKAIEAHLRQVTGDVTLTITNVEEGSIKITVEGSSQGIEKLASLFELGQLTEVLEFPVENVEVLPTQAEEEEKIRLIKEIKAQGARERDLTGADLSGAYLRGVDLSNADLFCADLSRAILSFADLSFTILSSAGLRDAMLKNAMLRNAILSSADLRDTNLSAANLSNTNLSGANVSNADLSNADLSGADLSFANLISANLRDANLRNANLRDAKLRNSNLNGADLSGAYLRSTHLSGADLSGANLKDSNLRNTNLREAIIDETTQIDSKWRLVWEIVNHRAIRRNLSNADLSDANLSDANLSDANLRGADLRGADLRGADLSYAIVEQAKFGGNAGLTEHIKLDLKKRGAIFEDSPGDRSGVLAR